MAKTSDKRKTKAQLIEELQGLSRQVAKLQKLEKEHKRAEEALEKAYAEVEKQVEERTVELKREIAERKQALEALREGEERYRRLVELSFDAVAIHREGRIVYINAAGAELLGASSPEELIGKPMLDFVHPDYLEVAKARMLQAAEGRIAPLIEEKLTRLDGTSVDAEVLEIPIIYQAQSAVQVVVGDITERKRAEEALRCSLKETARGQRLLLALSQAAQAVQRARTPDEVYRTIGDEVARLGYPTAIYTLSEERTELVSAYNTLEPGLLQAAEKLLGFRAQDYRIPLTPGSFYQRIITEGETVFFESFTEAIAEALPPLLRPLAGRVAAVLGIEQGIFVPLTVGDKTQGLLIVTGAGLTEADVPAVTTFANQAAIAIENARLYEAVQQELAERKRAEKAVEKAYAEVEKRVEERTVELKREIAERKRAEGALQQREAVLGAIALAAEKFLRPSDWEQDMQAILAYLGKAADVSRAIIWVASTSDDGEYLISGRYEWIAPEEKLAPLLGLQNVPVFRRWRDLLPRGEVITGHVRDFSAKEQEFFVPRGIKSVLVVPIFVNNAWWGFMGFDQGGTEREWTEAEIDTLRTAASILGGALERKRTEEALERRTAQLQVAAEVSRTASSTLDPDKLIQQVVELARERFDLYYAGLFLVDEVREWAVLRAGTGEAGWQMLEQGHRLEVGGESMIGWCVANKQARIALDVGEEAVRFDNPLLPETRSELALPLVTRGEAIGALTIQSTHEAAFSEEDIAVLQTMADQLANAIANARLYEQAQREIAERKQAEETLAEERNLLRTIIDNLPDYIYAKDTESRYFVSNTAHIRFLGATTQDEVVGKTVFELFPQELAAQFYAGDQEVIRSGQPLLDREQRSVDEAGNSVWNLTSKVPLRDSEGKIVGLVGISRDITEHKRAEAERERLLADVRQSERLLRAIIDATPDWIFIKDQQHRYVLVNQGYADALHLTPDDFAGKDDLDLGFPEELVRGNPAEGIRGYWADDRQVMDSGEPLIIPHDLATADGELRVFNTIKTPLRDVKGNVWGVLGLARDMTEREGLLADLERRSAQLQTAGEVSRAASSILDPDELIQQVVDLARERFDLYYAGLFLVDQSGEWTGEPGKWAMLRAGTGEAGQKMLEQGHKLEIGGTSMIGWCVANKQARIALDVGEEAVRFENPLLPETRSELALPLISRGEVIGALTIQSTREAAFSEEDITVLQTMADQLANAIANARLYEQAQREIAERKRAEEALARQAQELDAELDQFAHVAAHDLQEPLRTVASYVQLLERRYKGKLDEDADEFITYAVDGAVRVQALINDLLSLSRVTTRGKPFAPTDCSAALNRVLANLQVVIEDSGAVLSHDGLPTVMADEVQLIQVFQNLIINAIKFRSDRPPEVHVGVERNDGEWLFSVRDNGIGIDPQYFERIFGLFQRLHSREEYPGTGIGLAVCKKIVERHSGRIWVESGPGKGSTFYFTIPMIGGSHHG